MVHKKQLVFLRTTCLLILCAEAVIAPAAAYSQGNSPSKTPPGTGVHYKKSEREWVRLSLAPMLQTKPGGVGRFLETDGLSSLNVVYVYRGARASVQIAGRKPAFYVCGSDFAREAVIVQLIGKKDSREAHTASDLATYDNKAGYKKGAIRRVAIAAASDDCYTVTPEVELKPGEYLLALGSASAGYDFGIIAAKTRRHQEPGALEYAP